MNEYIKKEEALRVISDVLLETDPSGKEQIAVLKCSHSVRELPTADVALVVHGCWIEKPFLMGISRFCSKCGDNFGMPHGVYRYCPTCGAKMNLEAGANA